MTAEERCNVLMSEEDEGTWDVGEQNFPLYILVRWPAH
jgi:hypothetical protein